MISSPKGAKSFHNLWFSDVCLHNLLRQTCLNSRFICGVVFPFVLIAGYVRLIFVLSFILLAVLSYPLSVSLILVLFFADETSLEAGIRVQIHSQDEPPYIHQLGFGVSPGFQTFVSCQEQRV